MKKILIGMSFVTAMLFLSGCGVNKIQATKVLEAQGMKNVQIHGYSFWGCGEQDLFRSSFTAIGANGQQV